MDPVPPPEAALVGQQQLQHRPRNVSSKVQEKPASTEGPSSVCMEAHSNKPAQATTAATGTPGLIRDVVQIKDKGVDFPMVPTQHAPERTDSIDSYMSNFRNRTNTGWSTRSTYTDLTDTEDLPSPTGTFHDDPLTFDDFNASSSSSSQHRPSFSLPIRSATFQDPCPPSRVSSFAAAEHSDKGRPGAPNVGHPSDNTSVPLPRHSNIRRVQGIEMSSSPPKRSSFGKQPVFGNRSASFGPGHPPVRRPSNSGPGPLRGSASSDAEFHSGPNRTGIDEPDEPGVSIVKDENNEESVLGQVSPIPEEPEPLSACDDERSVRLTTPEEQDINEEEAVRISKDDFDMSGDDSDDMFQVVDVEKPDPEHKLDACNHLLQDLFGVTLEDLAATGSASEAYQSVSYCIDELANLVAERERRSTAIPAMNEAPRDGPSNASLRPTGGGCGTGANGAGGGGRDSKGAKRPSSGDNCDDGDSNGDGDDSNGNGRGNKKLRSSVEPPASASKYSCPFRRRNPVKFNVRDYQSCAVQPLSDISQVKRHIKNFHKQKATSPYRCQRCKRDLVTAEALEIHLNLPQKQMCPSQQTTPANRDPEEGITDQIEQVLNGRKANVKIDTWEAVWHTCFPEDRQEDVPSHEFVAPVELDEVHHAFHHAAGDLLSKILNERGLELEPASIHRLCQEHIESVIENCRRTYGNAPGKSNRRRKNNNSNNNGVNQLVEAKLEPTPSPIGGHHLLSTLPRLLPITSSGQQAKTPSGWGSGSNGSNPSSTADTVESIESWTNDLQLDQTPIAPRQPGYYGVHTPDNDSDGGDVSAFSIVSGAVSSGVISPDNPSNNFVTVTAPSSALMHTAHGGFVAGNSPVQHYGGMNNHLDERMNPSQQHQRMDSGVAVDPSMYMPVGASAADQSGLDFHAQLFGGSTGQYVGPTMTARDEDAFMQQQEAIQSMAYSNSPFSLQQHQQQHPASLPYRDPGQQQQGQQAPVSGVHPLAQQFYGQSFGGFGPGQGRGGGGATGS